MGRSQVLVSEKSIKCKTSFQNYTKRYEKLDSYYSDTAENDEKFVVSRCKYMSVLERGPYINRKVSIFERCRC